MDYTPLEKLVTTLQDQVQSLKSGNMNPDEVSFLVVSAREVYERLVVLEFQAFEKNAVPASTPAPKAFKIETNTVEEEIEEVEPELVSEPTEDVSIKIEAPAEPEIVKEVVQEIEEASAVEENEPEVEEKKEDTKEAQGSETEPAESLAEKFKQAPIEDIAKSISLNEKFQFIRVLCHNNAKNFEKLLEKVNNSKNEEEALSTFSALIPVPDSDDEKDVYEKFEELIKRRF